MNNNTYFKNYVSFNKYLLFYLLILGFVAIIHLYTKHTVGNDSTISEWIINYQGGFIRRGFIGEICFHIAKFFNSDLRFIIFLLQSTFYLLFLFLMAIQLDHEMYQDLHILHDYSGLLLCYSMPSHLIYMAKFSLYL